MAPGLSERPVAYLEIQLRILAALKVAALRPSGCLTSNYLLRNTAPVDQAMTADVLKTLTFSSVC